MVDLLWFSILGLVVLFVLFALGLEVAFTLGLLGALGLYFYTGGTLGLSAMGPIAFTNSNSFVLTAIPLFILLGAFLLHSGMGATLFDAGLKWFGRLPGGPIVGTLGGVAVFSAISGSSTACAATFGTVAIPELEKRGFDRRTIYGALAAGATLDIMIPPSVTMILYGAMTEQSVGRLFLAGVGPGIVLTILFAVYIIGLALLKPEWAPRAESYSWRERFLAVKDLIPAFVLIFVVLGGIYTGVTTPTEAAAVGALAAMILALLNRRLNWQVLESALLDAARTTSMIMIIVVSALFTGHVITKVGLPAAIGQWIDQANLSPWTVFFLICVIYLILGCLIDSVSMIVMTLPVVYPIMDGLGFDLIWFGIVLIVLVELSLITPPVGLNLYVIHGLAKGQPISDVFVGSAPYVVILVLSIGLLILWPDLALWLPNLLIGKSS